MNKRIINNDNKKIINSNTNLNSKEIITVKANTQLLHPLTCNLINTTIDKHDICLTKYDYNNDNFNFVKNYHTCKNNKYTEYLYIPPVGISSDVILKLYDINTIDSLYNWINDNINTTNIFTINRILNCWIINNITILKEHNAFLQNIYNKVIFKYANKSIISKINNNIINLSNETPKFIDYWINKINADFKFNLLNDYNIYLQKKYKNK
jgi:hypothetical protein